MCRTDVEQLIHRLIGGDATAIAQIVEAASTSNTPVVLVAAALVVPHGADLLRRAGHLATTTRDRQLVAIAVAHLAGERDVVDVLTRDHLADHPDSVLVAWIAAAGPGRTTVHDPSSDTEMS